MEKKIYLNVPFEEKDQAKAMGAWWDPQNKKWYLKDRSKISSFTKWIAKEDTQNNSGKFELVSPVYIVKSRSNCWKCHNKSEVFCLASEGVIENGTRISDFIVFSNISWMAEELKEIFSRISSKFRIDFSKTQESKLYMNHCQHCDAKMGDFFMHDEPGGAFVPENENQANSIQLYQLSGISKRVQISGSYGMQSPNYIQTNAKRSRS